MDSRGGKENEDWSSGEIKKAHSDTIDPPP